MKLSEYDQIIGYVDAGDGVHEHDITEEIAQLEAQVEAQGELLFQAGCNFVLNDQFYAGRTLFEAARRSGHLGAQEQLDALPKEGE